jgi:hypothetical protein
MKKIPLDDLQEKARLLTREALMKCVIPEDIEREKLFLSVYFDEDDRIFELYQSGGSTPDNDLLIAETRLNVFSGEGTVKTYLPLKKG